jgi:putative 4-mercaptohistidine N1-methyltranferase
LDHAPRHGHGDHDHEHEGCGSDYLFRNFITGQYAPPEELALYPFTPKELIEFHRKCADVCIKHKQEGVESRAMEVGCAAGRTSFELSRGFDSVLGVDISQAFVDKCNEIKRMGQTEYWLPGEGELGETKIAHLPPEINSSRVEFKVGDGCNLPALSPGPLGCIITCNTLCRVPDPAKLLEQARDLLVPGGTLVLVESYTWTEETTPKDKWLGGYKDKEGKEVDTFEALKAVLLPDFQLEEECVLQCVSRDAPRLFFWFLDHATVWRKRENH